MTILGMLWKKSKNAKKYIYVLANEKTFDKGILATEHLRFWQAEFIYKSLKLFKLYTTFYLEQKTSCHLL